MLDEKYPFPFTLLSGLPRMVRETTPPALNDHPNPTQEDISLTLKPEA